MRADHRTALLRAFETGMLPTPSRGEEWVVFNGRRLPEDPFDGADCVFEQGFRPEYLLLKKHGMTAEPAVEAERMFDHAVVMAGRVRAVNEANLARAWVSVGEGGRIIVAGDKTSGIASLRKWAAEQTEITDSFSKYHALVFWIEKNTKGGRQITADDVKPAFSAEAPDRGSILLSRFFGERIKGKVADFGAGTGFLTQQLLEKSPSVETVDLLEAEWAALQEARNRLAGSEVPLEFHWADITSELKKKPYHWIVMNPPFHHGLHGERQADPELGKRFIAQSASTLVQGGRLLMVANRNLPYERTLDTVFRKFEKLTDEDGFKVIEAVR